MPTKRGASHAAPRAMSTSLSTANMFAVELFQWWNSRIPVKTITMPYLSAVSMTLSSRMDPPGSAI